MATVGDPGNPSVGVIQSFGGPAGHFVNPPVRPKDTGIYKNCSEKGGGRATVVPYGRWGRLRYGIGEFDVTVSQYVTFVNMVDPSGRNALQLYFDDMNPAVWHVRGRQPGDVRRLEISAFGYFPGDTDLSRAIRGSGSEQASSASSNRCRVVRSQRGWKVTDHEIKPSVLFVYYSYTNQTKKVLDPMAEVFRVQGCEVTFAPLRYHGVKIPPSNIQEYHLEEARIFAKKLATNLVG